MKFIKGFIISTTLLVVTSFSQAALITTNEAALDLIYSQANFGATPIDIRIGAETELVFPDLLNITTDLEIYTLFGLHIGLPTIVNFYFVDTIDSCGRYNTDIVGCGEFPGNDFVVESSFSSSAFGGELLAHELGHNLGLGHLNGGLMNPFLNSNTDLSLTEVTSIFFSSLVQYNDGYYIDINPVLIVAHASNPAPVPIPEPNVVLLFLLSIGLIFQSKMNKSH